MEQHSLFHQKDTQPLAARLRPRTLEEFFGQKHLLGKGKVLRNLIESDKISSMIFWGPPPFDTRSLRALHSSNHQKHS